VSVEPGTGAVPRRRQPSGSTTFRCRETRGVVFQGGSPEVPPSPGAARLRAASAQDAQPPTGSATPASSGGSRDYAPARGQGTSAGLAVTCKARQAQPRHAGGALLMHFPRTCQRPVDRSMTALHPSRRYWPRGWRTQQPGQRVTLPLGQRAEASHHTRDPRPVIIRKLILGINAARATFRRVLPRTAGWPPARQRCPGTPCHASPARA
jgi:hypothetical protein